MSRRVYFYVKVWAKSISGTVLYMHGMNSRTNVAQHYSFFFLGNDGDGAAPSIERRENTMLQNGSRISAMVISFEGWLSLIAQT